MKRPDTCAQSAITEMDRMVNMSTAATRSTTVRPRTRRTTPNMIPKSIRTAAVARMKSAKDLLQVPFKRTGNDASGLVRISGLDIEPMNEQCVVLHVQHERARCQRNGIRQRQPAKRGLQLRLDPHNA